MLDASTKDFYNHIEPYIWYLVAILIVPALRKHAPLGRRLTLAAVICIFGTSDFFETEAWWTPWWLLLWKAISLCVMLLMGLRIRKASRASTTTASGKAHQGT